MLALYILHKINYFLHKTTKSITHPINLGQSSILIKTNKGIKTIDRLSIMSDNIDDILDISTLAYIDKLL
jgi:hypothetical protein